MLDIHLADVGRWRTWLVGARRYCVMEARERDAGLVGFVVVDLQAKAVDSRHGDAETARRAADGLVSAAAAEDLGGGRP
jgi:hypothetical protein